MSTCASVRGECSLRVLAASTRASVKQPLELVLADNLNPNLTEMRTATPTEQH